MKRCQKPWPHRFKGNDLARSSCQNRKASANRTNESRSTRHAPQSPPLTPTYLTTADIAAAHLATADVTATHLTATDLTATDLTAADRHARSAYGGFQCGNLYRG